MTGCVFKLRPIKSNNCYINSLQITARILKISNCFLQSIIRQLLENISANIAAVKMHSFELDRDLKLGKN